MTSFNTDDPIDRLLGRLPAASPDAARSERVRARCAAVLSQGEVRRRRPQTRARRIECTVVGGFCVIYLAAVIRQTALVLLAR